MPRCLLGVRPPSNSVLPLPQYPGALLHRLPKRYWYPASARADGFCSLGGGLSRRPLVHFRSAQQRHPVRAYSHRTGKKRCRCTLNSNLWSRHPVKFSNLDRRDLVRLPEPRNALLLSVFLAITWQ
jgi:hypothetical protein